MKKPGKITTYETIFDDQNEAKEVLRSISHFDTDHHLIKRETFDEKGNIVQRVSHEYKDGHEIRSTEEDLIEGHTTETISDYKEGLLSHQKEYYDHELTLEMTYSYNEEGLLIMNKILNNDQTLNSQYTYEYSDKNTIEKYYDEDMVLVRITETRENDEDRITYKKVTEIYDNREVVREQRVELHTEGDVSIDTYFLDGVESYEVERELDENGRVIETTEFDLKADDDVVTRFTYNEFDKVVQEEKIKNDEPFSIKFIEYDRHGNGVEITEEQHIDDEISNKSAFRFVNEYHDEEE